MIWALLSTILESISSVFGKKALLYSKISPVAFQFYSELLPIPILFVLLYVLDFDYRLFFSLPILTGFLIINLSFLLYNRIEQRLYREEKMSVLLPYFKIHNFILIVAGYFLFHDATLLAFIICLVSIVLTIVLSFNFSEREFPKNSWSILLHQVLKSTEILTVAYVLKYITEVDYIIIFQVTYIFMAFVVVAIMHQLGEIKKLTKIVAKNQLIAYFTFYGTFIIGAFLIKEFGLIMTMLFGFFGSGLSLFLAYLMFREVPSKKDIFLGILLIVLVFVAYYFKPHWICVHFYFYNF